MCLTGDLLREERNSPGSEYGELIENHIRKCETFKIPSVLQTSRRQGMVLMDDCLLDLWRAGRITKEEALERSFDRKALAVRMGGAAE